MVARSVFKIIAGLLAIYIALAGALLLAMYQPPRRFGKIAAGLPRPLFALVPFQALWSVARGGHLRIGDAAPDFDLQTIDKQSRVRLSAFRGQKPVVLVFGSYT